VAVEVAAEEVVAAAMAGAAGWAADAAKA